MKNRLFPIAAVAVMVGLGACAGEEAGIEGETDIEATSVTPVVTSETEMAPVVTPVTTTDTAAVVTTVDAEVEREVVADPALAPTEGTVVTP